MDKRFSIKAKYFSLYQAFREEAEKAGWVYNSIFNPFEESKMRSCNCLFFSTQWERDGWDPKFSFSNGGAEEFNLPDEWDEAIEYMQKAIDEGKPEAEANGKISISLKALADYHGVKVDDIIIIS